MAEKINPERINSERINSERIKVGVAGLGRSGWNMHVAALANLPEQYHITAVMDLSRDRCTEANARFGCETFNSFDDLLKADTELIVVASPSQFHSEHTLVALEAGKHVIVEKPFAASVAQVDQMIAVAKKANKLLTVNQNYRYHSDFRTMSEIMLSGKLGEIVQIRVAVHQFSRRWDWQTLRKNNGGILTNHGSHALDWLLLHIEDDDPEVFCHLVATPLYAGDAESHAKVIIRPKKGPLLDVELTHCNAYPQDTYLIMGTQGTLSGTRKHLRWKYFIPGHEVKLRFDPEPTFERSYNSEKLSFTEESTDLNNLENADMVALYQDLYTTIRNGKALVITAESVRRQIHIFEKCKASAGWV